MSIGFRCSGCDKTLKANDSMAGKVAACPHCGTKVRVPAAGANEAANTALNSAGKQPVALSPKNSPGTSETARTRQPAQESPTDESRAAAVAAKSLPTRSTSSVSTSASPPSTSSTPTSSTPKPRASEPAQAIRSESLRAKNPPSNVTGLKMRETPFWLRHLHWLLALALIPLAVSLLQPEDESSLEDRIRATIDHATPEEQARIASVLTQLESADAEVDVFGAMPGGKLEGAWLARGSHMHWLLALISAAIFMSFFSFLAVDKSAVVSHLLLSSFFTATIGIFLLIVVQLLADVSVGLGFRGRGIGLVIIAILKFIGFSYRAALDPENGFWPSFLGFTFGVGLCEELCKAMPVLWRFREPNSQSWRGAFLWGLASGAGFGIAEGIKYSGEMYNGIFSPGVYLVRFLSCVALHALWSGSVGITTQQNQSWLQTEIDSWHDYIIPVLRMIAVPMVLHGLYDTLLKKGMNGWALVAALVSFGFLAFQISRLRGEDDEASRAEFLRNYAMQRRLGTSK